MLVSQVYYYHYSAIAPGIPEAIGRAFDKISAERINSGTQGMMFAGNIIYNDGFSGTPQQVWPFCYVTRFVIQTKQVVISPCDPTVYLPELRSIDGYPNNEDDDGRNPK
jgi:hypothetical protein